MVTRVPAAPLPGETLDITGAGTAANVVGLLADPPEVVTSILPLTAPDGTTTIILPAESLVIVVALIPPKVTVMALARPDPVMVTTVPAAPPDGDTALMEGSGMTVKFVGLDATPPAVVTTISPAPAGAPLGTVAMI